MNLREIFENIARTGEAKTAVVGWGRGMGHRGHMFLADAVIKQAENTGADPYFVVSRTVGKDDPITPEEKLHLYKQVFPKMAHIFHSASDELPDLNRVLKHLAGMGYGDVTLVLGADQVKPFQYLVRPDKSGVEPFKQFGLNSLHIMSRQEVQGASQEEGPRATPMRDVLNNPAASEEEKFKHWRDSMSPEVDDDQVRDLMHKAHTRMADFNKPKVRAKKAVATENKSVKYANQKIRDRKLAVAEGSSAQGLSSIKARMHPHHLDASQGYTLARDVGGYDRTYHLNRMGMAMAMADGRSKKPVTMDDSSWTEKYNVYFPYSDIEQMMVNQALATIPSDGQEMEKRGKSKEPNDTNKTSSVAKIKKNKYGI